MLAHLYLFLWLADTMITSNKLFKCWDIERNPGSVLSFKIGEKI